MPCQHVFVLRTPRALTLNAAAIYQPFNRSMNKWEKWGTDASATGKRIPTSTVPGVPLLRA